MVIDGDSEFAADYRAYNRGWIGNEADAFRDFEKWWLRKAAEAAELGTHVALLPASIVNEGLDWVLTAQEVAKGNLTASIGFLPIIPGGIVKQITSGGHVIFKFTADLQRYIRLGKLGKGFANHAELVGYLGRAGDNMHWHHLVEQHSKNLARFGAEAIHNTSNAIAIPDYIHERINKLFGAIREDITGSATMTVRQWISQKSYREQFEFGVLVVENVLAGIW